MCIRVLCYTLGQKRVRYGECTGCTSSNCTICKYCCDNLKYGGPGKLKKACIQQKYIKMQKRSEQTLRSTSMYTNRYTYIYKHCLYASSLLLGNHQQTDILAKMLRRYVQVQTLQYSLFKEKNHRTFPCFLNHLA